jgi:uncharacterized protein
MSQANVDVVRRAYEAWNRGDAYAASEFLSPDIEWEMPPNLPDPETWRGREAVIRGLEGLSESWEELVADLHQLIDAGDRVVALVRFHGRSVTTGMALDGVSVDGQVWTFRAGRVVSVQMYSGSEAALRAVGLAE